MGSIAPDTARAPAHTKNADGGGKKPAATGGVVLSPREKQQGWVIAERGGVVVKVFDLANVEIVPRPKIKPTR